MPDVPNAQQYLPPLPNHEPNYDGYRLHNIMRTIKAIIALDTSVTLWLFADDPQTRADWHMCGDPTDPGVSVTFVLSTNSETDGSNCVTVRCVSNEVRLYMRNRITAELFLEPPHTDHDSDHWEL